MSSWRRSRPARPCRRSSSPMRNFDDTPEQAQARVQDEAAQTAATASGRTAAKAELERRLANERGRYYVPNGKVEQFINSFGNMQVDDQGIKIFILRAGNGLGKSAVVTNLANYL